MLLSETVEIRIINNNKKYFESKGYSIDGDFIKVNVEDLPNGSKIDVLVKCDICGSVKYNSYYNYNKSIRKYNLYTCSSKCSNIKKKMSNKEKFGTEWASQSRKIKNKVSKTNLEKFGHTCSLQSEEIKQKVNKKNIEKFGTEFPSKSDIVKNKKKKTNLEKFGVENVFECNEIKEKIKKTNLEKFGHENPMKNPDVLNKAKETKLEKYDNENFNNREKAKISNLDKYGVEHFSKTKEFLLKTKETSFKRYGKEHYSKTASFKEKVKKTKKEKYNDENFNNRLASRLTNIKRYGVEYTLQDKNVRKSIETTNFEKYGVKSILQLPEVIKKRKESSSEKNKLYALSKYKELISDDYEIKDYSSGDFIIYHKKCKEEFTSTLKLIYDRINLSTDIEICTKCNPKHSNSSSGEVEIYNWLISLELNVELRKRNIIESRELDLYLPDYKLAIEYNGLYWHNELFKSKNYHLSKTLKCKELGIDLIHIFEDDWRFKKDIIKSIILNRLNLINNKIYARNCQIRSISLNECKKFINDNHIQGYSRSKYKLGLFHKGELVSVMTFGYRKTNSKNEFELIRFCNKKFLNVVGSASKLFKYFIRNINGVNNIISYADISLFTGSMYEKLNFKLIHLTDPNYYWVVGDRKYHRFKYNKKKLVKQFNLNSELTETEIMNNLGNYKIWSCGQLRYEYII